MILFGNEAEQLGFHVQGIIVVFYDFHRPALVGNLLKHTVNIHAKALLTYRVSDGAIIVVILAKSLLLLHLNKSESTGEYWSGIRGKRTISAGSVTPLLTIGRLPAASHARQLRSTALSV